MDCCANMIGAVKSDDRSPTGAIWRADIDALTFWIGEHSASCAVHRRAFRTLMRRDPMPQDCVSYFGKSEHAFRAAALAKVARNRIPAGTSLHLTSRDVARKLLEPNSAKEGDD